jgi:hypothetical protein
VQHLNRDPEIPRLSLAAVGILASNVQLAASARSVVAGWNGHPVQRESVHYSALEVSYSNLFSMNLSVVVVRGPDNGDRGNSQRIHIVMDIP